MFKSSFLTTHAIPHTGDASTLKARCKTISLFHVWFFLSHVPFKSISKHQLNQFQNFQINFKASFKSISKLSWKAGPGLTPSTTHRVLQKRNLLSSVIGLEHQLTLRDNSVIPKYPSHTGQIIWKLKERLPSVAFLLPCVCPASSVLEVPTGLTRSGIF